MAGKATSKSLRGTVGRGILAGMVLVIAGTIGAGQLGAAEPSMAGATVQITNGALGKQLAELVPSPSSDTPELFGFNESISGKTAVVGDPDEIVNHSSQGAAHVFANVNGVWTQTAHLVASDGVTGDGCGYAVAVSGTTILVGGPGHNGRGAVYVYDETGTAWTLSTELFASGEMANDQFGHVMA
jgi:hypothetical protein